VSVGKCQESIHLTNSTFLLQCLTWQILQTVTVHRMSAALTRKADVIEMSFYVLTTLYNLLYFSHMCDHAVTIKSG